jgi:hypothetical protein
MGFIQLIELDTTDFDEIERHHEKWLAATEGERTVIGEWVTKDRDRPDHYVLIVEFPSWEAAMRNNELPATDEIARSMAKSSSGPPTFRNLDVIRKD